MLGAAGATVSITTWSRRSGLILPARSSTSSFKLCTPSTSVVKVSLKMRDDKVTDGGQPVAVTQNAPEGEDHFFAVPKVVE